MLLGVHWPRALFLESKQSTVKKFDDALTWKFDFSESSQQKYCQQGLKCVHKDALCSPI